MNNSITVYQYGTTVRFEAEFFNFAGVATTPETVKLKIYDSKYVELTTENGIAVTGAVGKYFFDYVTPKKEQRLYYEWYAEIEGKPSLKRGEFITKFL